MLRSLIAAATILISAGASAAEPPRFALVAGAAPNGALAPLVAANAEKAAGALRAAGFDVEMHGDLDQNGLRRAVREFTARVEATRGAAQAVLYLGGPVMQAGGRNFLVARGADVRRASDVPIEGVAVGDLLSALAAVPAKGRLLIVDALKNAPVDGIVPGIAPIDPAKGTFVAVSAAAGAALPDGENAGRFADAFADALALGNSDVDAVFERVSDQVRSDTGGAQSPTRVGALLEPFMIGAAKTTARATPPVAPAVPAPPPAETVTTPPAAEQTASISPAPPRDDAEQAAPASVDDQSGEGDVAGDGAPETTAGIAADDTPVAALQPDPGANAGSEPQASAAPDEPAADTAALPADPAPGSEQTQREPETASPSSSSEPPSAAGTDTDPTVPLPPTKPKAPPRVASLDPRPGDDLADGDVEPRLDRSRPAGTDGSSIVRPRDPQLNPGYLVYLGPRAAYQLVVRSRSPQAYAAFVRAYPNHPLAAEMRARVGDDSADEQSWRRAVAAGTPGSFRAYLQRFPAGLHRAEAQSRLGRATAAIPPRPAGPSPFAPQPFAPPAGAYGAPPPGFD